MKKRLFLTVLMLMLTANIRVCFAYTFPNSFWKMNDAFTAASESGDTAGIIEFGNQSINLMLTQPECTETVNVLADRYQKVAQAYAAQGRYNESADAFEKLLPYAQKVGWNDSIIIAKAKILQYRSQTQAYTSGYANTFYGAKNEKENGILFGVCSNGGIRDQLENASMVLVYQQLGEGLSGYNKNELQKANDNGLAVEYALNCPNEAADIAGISGKESEFAALSAEFAKYPNMKIYLRFGAEFDVWSNMAEPQSFIDAFRYVSDYFKSRNENVAIVWSPNQVSSWGTNIDDFYPGDSYVDWVGISLYSMPYFLGNAAIDNDYTEAVFKTGINADPVLAIKNIAETYAGRQKPIMISESGFSHSVSGVSNDTTAWALQKMNEFYSYLPMVYPQIKLIAYFDHYVAPEVNDFRLSDSPVLADRYKSLTKGPRFIQNGYDGNTAFAYNPIASGKVFGSIADFYTYSHIYGEDVTETSYYIDGNFVGSSKKMPFACYADLTAYSNGEHTLKVVSVGSKGTASENEYTINIQNTSGGDITVMMDNSNIEFDQKPVVYNSRTMVPMRAIFNAMGAEVNWNQDSQTVTGTKGGTTVSISIGGNVITVNGKDIPLDTPAILLGGRTLVPVRAIAESFACDVGWDGASKTVTITQK